MRKLILIVHTSIDGFAAGENGEFDGFDPSPENLDFVCSLTAEADALLAGRVSYQMLESYWPTAHNKEIATESEINYSNWYNSVEKIIMSKSLTKMDLEKTTVISGNIANRIHEIKRQKGKNILMFGSPSAFQTLNDLNLIDEYWIINYPVFFGKGLPFFTRAQTPKRFKLLSSRQFSKGEIAVNYRIEQ